MAIALVSTVPFTVLKFCHGEFYRGCLEISKRGRKDAPKHSCGKENKDIQAG